MGEQDGARDRVAHHQADDADVAEEKGYQGPGPVGDPLIPRLPPAFPPSAPTAITSALPAPITARRAGRFVRFHPGHLDRITDLRTSRFRFTETRSSYFYPERISKDKEFRKLRSLSLDDLSTIWNVSRKGNHTGSLPLETAVEELRSTGLSSGRINPLTNLQPE